MGDLSYSLPTVSVAQEKVANAAASVGSWGVGLWKWKSKGGKQGRERKPQPFSLNLLG